MEEKYEPPFDMTEEIAKLKEEGILKRTGSNKTGYWSITDRAD